MKAPHTINFTAGDVGFAIQAIQDLQGRKPIMLSYRLGQVLGDLRQFQTAFVENIKPYLDEAGALCDDADRDIVEALCAEPLQFAAPRIRLEELEDLTAESPDTIPVLLRLGIVVE
jgi:hypothetical protein